MAYRRRANWVTETEGTEKIRIDKWLWAARFYKTRSMASQAVAGGRVHINGARVKPARIVQCGEKLKIRRGEEEFIVTVLGVSDKRRPAKEARLLYEETKESITAREHARDERRLLATDYLQPTRRPTKRERRQIVDFTRRKG